MDHSEKLTQWCPNHHLEDNCYSNKLQEKWEALKTMVPDPENWNFYEDSHQMIHKTNGMGIAANVEFWWREKRYI